jgi:hypothetical protein
MRRVEMRLHQNAARTGDDAPGGFARACIASRQEKSEEERGNSAFPSAKLGPNHNLTLHLAKYYQVTEIKGCYYWAIFGRNA